MIKGLYLLMNSDLYIFQHFLFITFIIYFIVGIIFILFFLLSTWTSLIFQNQKPGVRKPCLI